MEIQMLRGDKSSRGDQSGIGTRIQDPWWWIVGLAIGRLLISFHASTLSSFQALQLSRSRPAVDFTAVLPPIPVSQGGGARDGQ
jgi:hypothetical protein